MTLQTKAGRELFLEIGNRLPSNRGLYEAIIAIEREASRLTAFPEIRARHSFHDGRVQDPDTCPDEDHATDLHTLLAAVAPEQVGEPCVHCGGRRWTEDENWWPDDPRTWKGERAHGDGLIPCGACNEGGWTTPDFEKVSPESAEQVGEVPPR